MLELHLLLLEHRGTTQLLADGLSQVASTIHRKLMISGVDDQRAEETSENLAGPRAPSPLGVAPRMDRAILREQHYEAV